ncbi:LytTR family DNA-binding domain-containing protein [Alteripontixanthobacter maritimus]|nr:LytTR family DNA-binding domain-containing protein [Alteripontixanthobacter maritimus]
MRDLPSGWVQNGFIVRPFVPIALIWQLFQGLLLYTVVAMASLAAELATRVRVQEALFGKSERVTATNLIVKEGSEHSSVGFDEIIRVSGADEYIEVVLAERSILTTSSLAQIEARLPENLFFRAHRSHIVRFGAIVRSEPAGNGRTTLHLMNGNAVITSRSGTRLLRESAI